MIIAPETIFNAKDISRARRLNAWLDLFPRFRPAGRVVPTAINVALRMRSLMPSPAQNAGGVQVAKRKFWIGDRTVAVRCLIPNNGKPTFLYLYYHGGAWVTMDARICERLLIPLVRERNCVVMLPEFHRATDDRVDRTFGDARAALDAAMLMCREQAIPFLVVGGESSGAHLALSAILDSKMRGGGVSISGFVAVCGAFDIIGNPTLKAAETDTLIMDASSAQRNLDRLFSGHSAGTCLAPLQSDLSHLPPCLLIAGALDPIVGDTIDLFSRWQDQSGNARMLIVPEAPHGFHWLPTCLARKSLAYAHDWISAVEPLGMGSRGSTDTGGDPSQGTSRREKG